MNGKLSRKWPCGYDWYRGIKVVILDREKGKDRDEEEREARRRQMAWTAEPLRVSWPRLG